MQLQKHLLKQHDCRLQMLRYVNSVMDSESWVSFQDREGCLNVVFVDIRSAYDEMVHTRNSRKLIKSTDPCVNGLRIFQTRSLL